MYKPQWKQGLFLTPNHLQQQDLYHERRLQACLRALAPQAWGFIELELNQAELDRGVLAFDKLAAIFPEGTLVGGAAGALPAPQSFEAYFESTTQTLPMHLTMPLEAASGPNVADSEAVGVASKYRESWHSAADFNAGGSEQKVSCIQPNVTVTFGPQLPPSASHLYLGELARDARGRFGLVDSAVPTFLSFSASEFLRRGVRETLGVIAARQSALSKALSRRLQGSPDVDAASLWLLGSLSEASATLSHLSDLPGVHPERLHSELVRIGGALSVFASDPLRFPRFDFNRLGPSFERLFEQIQQLSATSLVDAFIQVPLTAEGQGRFTARLAGGAANRELYLEVRPEHPADELWEQVPRMTKISGAAALDRIIGSAMNGVRVRACFQPPSVLPLQAGAYFFHLDKSSEFWSQVESEQRIGIYCPPTLRQMELRLFAVEDPTTRSSE